MTFFPKIKLINPLKKMKIVNILSGFWLLLFGYSCSQRGQQHDVYQTQETVVIKIPTDFDISPFDSLIKRMDFIPLETLDTCLISRVVQVRCTDSLVFINDNRHRVLAFDKKGRFRHQVGINGSGPGEYREVRDFFLTGDTIKVLDFCKIESYSLSGEHLATHRIDFGDKRISPIFFINAPSGDGYYFWGGTTGHNDRNLRTKYHFMYKTNNDFRVTDSIFPIRHAAGGNTQKFIKVGSCTVLDPLFADYNIYQIGKDNRIYARYVLDFGDKALTDNILEEVDRKNGSEFDEELHKYVVQMFDFAENPKWVLVNFGYKQRMYCLLYSKANKKSYLFTSTRESVIKGEYLFWGGQTCMNEQFIYCMEASWFVDIFEQLPDDAKKKYGLDNEICKKIKEADNPILVFYTMIDE